MAAVDTLKQAMMKRLGVADPWESDYEHRDLDPQGWFSRPGRVAMDLLCRRRHPRVVIELGSWLGKSTRFLAKYCDLVIAVDHWLGSPEHQDAYGSKIPTLFDQFLSNCEPQKDKILPLRMTSSEAATLPLPLADLIYIDADHSEAAVKSDIADYYGYLTHGGILCGDDYDPVNERGCGIARAVHSCAVARGLSVGVRVPVWWYEPVARP